MSEKKSLIFMDEPNDEKIIEQELKKHFKEVRAVKDFQTFWYDFMHEDWNLVVVDVKNMGQQQLVLKNHPKVREDLQPLLFYFNDKTVPLLASTYSILNYGSIKGGEELSVQLRGHILRINKIEEIKKNQKDMQFELARMQSRAVKLHETHQKLLIKNEGQSCLKGLFKELSEHSHKLNFTDLIVKVFSEWDKVKRFSYFEIDPSLTKLISPPMVKDKFKPLPSLWLGQANSQGIEFFAQNMSMQVASDVLGIELQCIRVFGKYQSPDILIYLTLEGDFAELIDWELVENTLSSFYRKYLLIKKQMVEDDKVKATLNPWELFDLIELHSKNKNINELNIIDLNLNPLSEILKSNPSIKLNWVSFFEDFIYGLTHMIKLNFKIGFTSISRVSLIVEKKDLDAVYTFAQKYARDFSYWRYFENADSLFSRLITIPVKMIPFSTVAYLIEMEGTKDTRATAIAKDRINDDFDRMFNKNIFGNA